MGEERARGFAGSEAVGFRKQRFRSILSSKLRKLIFRYKFALGVPFGSSFWRLLGTILEHLGTLLAPCGALWEPLGSIFGSVGRLVAHLGAFWATFDASGVAF